MLTDAQGCAVLTEVFEARGFAIERDVKLAEGDLEFTADGWDAAARVGFEYLTHEAGDHLDLTPEELQRLAARMEAGELYVFVIDEGQIEDPDELRWAAERFLDEVTRRKGSGA